MKTDEEQCQKRGKRLNITEELDNHIVILTHSIIQLYWEAQKDKYFPKHDWH